MTALQDVRAVALTCNGCPLAKTRSQVVFGSGSETSDLMLIGEAPGRREDERGVPFAGDAGVALDELLDTIGRSRGDVFVTNVLLCRPPGNRDPEAQEIERCLEWLGKQAAIVVPHVVATLGDFPTKILAGSGRSITAIHGHEQQATVGGVDVWLYPMLHPGLALHAPAMRKVLERDFARIPALLGTEIPSPPLPEDVNDEQLWLFANARGAYAEELQ